jgi:hypothetical protein
MRVLGTNMQIKLLLVRRRWIQFLPREHPSASRQPPATKAAALTIIEAGQQRQFEAKI